MFPSCGGTKHPEFLVPGFFLRQNDGNKMPFSDRFLIVPVMLRHEASSIDGYVYILASQRNGTLYVGVTSNLSQRIEQHKGGYIEGFTKKYHVHTLVYYEVFEQFTEVLIREKVLKGITRKRKIELIEQYNPQWKDLANNL